jgi:hypothetical protein
MRAEHEKGRGDPVARPLSHIPMSSAGCPTGITCQRPDGDAHKVSRNALTFKCAVAEFHGDGDEHLTCHG